MSTNLAIILGAAYGIGCVFTMALVFYNWQRRSVPAEGQSPFFAALTSVVWPITVWFLIVAVATSFGPRRDS